jgi:hypothetical protein
VTDYWRLLLESNSSRVHSESRVALAEERGQYKNPEEGKRPSFEAVTRRLVKGQQTEKTQYLLQ